MPRESVNYFGNNSMFYRQILARLADARALQCLPKVESSCKKLLTRTSAPAAPRNNSVGRYFQSVSFMSAPVAAN